MVYRFRKVVGKDALDCARLVVVVPVRQQIGAAIGHGTVEGVPIMVGTGHVDGVLVREIHVDLGAAGEVVGGVGAERGDDG